MKPNDSHKNFVQLFTGNSGLHRDKLRWVDLIKEENMFKY